MKRIYRPNIKAILIALCSIALLVPMGGLDKAVHADPPWPTPPPAPRAPQPVIQPSITPVELPVGQSSALWVVHPIPQGRIPLIPPVTNDTFEAPEYLTVTIEAGTLDSTIQLTFDREPVGAVPDPYRLQRLIEVFDLTAYDYQGQEIDPTFRRPWVLEVSLDELQNRFEDPNRLVFARFEDGRWSSIITNYFKNDRVLVARIMATGRFAILEELPPV